MVSKILRRLGAAARKAGARIIESGTRRGARKQPSGAITFQYAIFNDRPVDWRQVDSLRKRFGYSDIFMFHAVAMQIGDKAVVVAGPRSIGKSSLMRGLFREGKAIPIDDGVAIVGRRGGSFYAVETGTLAWRNLRSRMSNLTRFSRTKLFVREGLSKRRFKIGRALSAGEAALSENVASLLTRNRGAKSFTPREIPIGKIVYLPHQHDWHQPMKIEGHSIRNIPPESVNSELSGANIVVISPFREKEEIGKKLRNEVLSS